MLVLTHDADVAADAVCAELDHHDVRVVRFDVADFPQRVRFEAFLGVGASGWLGEIHHLPTGTSLKLESIRAVYFRKPNPFDLPNDVDALERTRRHLEAQAGFLGVLAQVDARWVNHPAAENLAAYKPIQLARAAAAGLDPPRSVIANDPAALAAFVSQQGGRAYSKGIGKELAGRPGVVPVLPNRVVAALDLDELGDLTSTAFLLQEPVTKIYDVRVVAVGSTMHAVAIHATSEHGRLDWRLDYGGLRYELIKLPERIGDGLRSMMSSYGLQFAAFDFSVAREGRWRFLEMNWNGEWRWLATELDLPVAAELAGLLSG